MSSRVRGFFAYPSQPTLIPEVIGAAIEKINDSQVCVIKDWVKCRVSGKLIISVICQEIDNSDIFCADITGFNHNVLFELGYAIARKKRIWLVLDPSIKGTRQIFDQLRVLTTVGYAPYCNSDDIIKGFFRDQPWTDLQDTIFARVIQPSLQDLGEGMLFYLKSRHETQAAIAVSKTVSKAGFSTIIDDPRESAVQPLAWYGQKTYQAIGVLVHFSGLNREGAELHNARYALVSGLAHGLQKSLLMLWESSYPSPIDYRDLLKSYNSASECEQHTKTWIRTLTAAYEKRQSERTAYRRKTELSEQLRNLRFGEHIAENEEEALGEYFLETSSYREALEGRHIIFVGRKGTGKTANLYRIASNLREDKRNLVCVVKPVGYELSGIVRLLGKYREADAKGYLVQSLWKFLLYTEIAAAAAREIESRPAGVLRGSPEDGLLKLLGSGDGHLRQDFAVRLENSVDSLFQDSPTEGSIEALRTAISEGLHSGVLRELRAWLGKVLTGRNRVAILIDNLDKAWDKRQDLSLLSEFLVGLLGVARDVQKEFSGSDHWRHPVDVTVTIFMRSDIFDQLMKIVREPDKVSYSRIDWRDLETLIRVIEQRFVASAVESGSPTELWSRWFCNEVRGQSTKEYLVTHILPRPRDMVYFCNAAIAVAVNRGHERVEEKDILEAERQYSQYVLDTVMVENEVTVPELESSIYEFVGRKAVLSETELRNLLAKGGISVDRQDLVIQHLCDIAFLGLEVHPEEFRFSAEQEDGLKNQVLAKRLAENHGGELRYKVNLPFHAFLEIEQ